MSFAAALDETEAGGVLPPTPLKRRPGPSTKGWGAAGALRPPDSTDLMVIARFYYLIPGLPSPGPLSHTDNV
jgi:hypothetical protein